ncbi:Ubiquitin carboxyl-terminal hydrolase 32, partial [Ophiophagus hannah]
MGRSKGRLRLPQLCKNKLSSSKENLDTSRENGTQPDPKATLDSPGREQQNLGDSSGEPVAAQDNEGQLTNGYLCKLSSSSNHSLNGPLEARREEELVDDQRGEICINPIYNLYAIS